MGKVGPAPSLMDKSMKRLSSIQDDVDSMLIKFSSQSSSLELKRIVRPIADTFEINTSHTVVRALFGDSAGRKVFGFSRSMCATLALWMLWIIGAVLVLSSWSHFVSQLWGWIGAALTQPGVLFIASQFNTKVLKELLGTFQVLFAILNVAALVCLLGYAFSDQRAGTLALLATNFGLSSFTDAAPAHGRKITCGIFYISNFVGLVWIQAIIISGDTSGLSDESLKIGSREFSALSLASNAALNLTVLALRNVWTLFKHPDCLVLITSRMQNIKMVKAEADFEMVVRNSLSPARSVSIRGDALESASVVVPDHDTKERVHSGTMNKGQQAPSPKVSTTEEE